MNNHEGETQRQITKMMRELKAESLRDGANMQQATEQKQAAVKGLGVNKNSGPAAA